MNHSSDECCWDPDEFTESDDLSDKSSDEEISNNSDKEEISESDAELFKLIQKGDVEHLKSLLSSGANIAARKDGDTLLHQAVEQRQKACVLALLEKDPSLVTENDWCGQTPLMWACQMTDNQEFVEILCAYPSCLDMTDKWGHTALHYAARNKSGLQTTAALLASKAKVHAVGKYKRSALSEAIRYDNLETVELLFKRGVCITDEDVLRVNIIPQWPMMRLLCKLDPSIITRQFFLEKIQARHTKNPWLRSLLTQVACKGSCSQVQDLLDLGATQLTAALFWAIKKCNLEVVKYLVDRGANFMETSPGGQNAFEIACNSRAEEVFKFLLELDWSGDSSIQNNPAKHPQSIVLKNPNLRHLFRDLIVESKWRSDYLMVEGKGPISYMLSYALDKNREIPWILEMMINAGYPVRGPGSPPFQMLCKIKSDSCYAECFHFLLIAGFHVPVDRRLNLHISQEAENGTPKLKTADLLALHYGMPYRPFWRFLQWYFEGCPLLLRFYAGPPLSFLLLPDIKFQPTSLSMWIRCRLPGVINYYWTFACHGLPLGTETASRLKNIMMQAGVEANSDHIYKDKNPREEFNKIRSHFDALLGRPPTLVTLSKFAYRRVLGKLAAETDKGLPDVVETEVPPGLKRLFDIDVSLRCLGDKHCSCPEHLNRD